MSSSSNFTVPGFDLAEWNRGGTYPHAIICPPPDAVTLREKRMLEFINQITDKPNWVEKVWNEEIVAKWRAEACGTALEQETSPNHLSQKCFDYCIKELRDKASYFQKYGCVHVLDVETTIVKTDLDEQDDFCRRISEAIRPLEDVPDSCKDWHPGSNGIVLDLVHPSLFPLEYGVTRVLSTGTVPLKDCLEYIGAGIVCPVPQQLTGEKPNSAHLFEGGLKPWGSYQWLPTDVQIQSDGSSKLMGYINNLHPQRHPELYQILETAVDKAIPVWNECLGWFHDRTRIPVYHCGFKDYKFSPEGYNPAVGNKEDEYADDPREEFIVDHPKDRLISQRDPQNFLSFDENLKMRDLSRLDLRSKYPDGLQVIFKLANIHLTPEQPHYDGSSWHVEGALNEHICATALFYFDQENIQDSYLTFRHKVCTEQMMSKPAQNEWEAAEDLFGIEKDGPPVQELGRVLTRQGRVIGFPNVNQHRLTPFGLADPTKPGHRKILAMFLVDPNIRILSTSNVPPQQRSWWAEKVQGTEPFASLPPELFDQINEAVDDFPISWKAACDTRESLMAERGRLTDDVSHQWHEVGSPGGQCEKCFC